MYNNNENREFQSDYWEYLKSKRETYRNVRVKKIFMPYDRWFDSRFSLRGKEVLDIGCLIESNLYRKHIRDNGSPSGYHGFDVADSAVNWLCSIDAFYDIYGTTDEALFDNIFLIDVYEHLLPDERIEVLKVSNRLLKENCELYVSFPYTKNLNFLINFVGDWSHKIVDLEAEVSAFMAFGGFHFDNIEVRLGGWTMPFRSALQNITAVIRNLVCLFPPFHVGIIIAKKQACEEAKNQSFETG